ncbi:DUF4386 domain-containing protein [Flagellimonas allohymeniacidonis]|uniref:DUF4386 domain-containing protein n=1 Tax=Flagellimonas allohymeniacidonis TaxID=2517819 RepID=A0A4V2HSH8_9FLAO|nr:DUF4386 domain-containing protein [Allomuricauda hymeniacidonis]TAI47820.1 DUF4386 domain-containing protein [Allomuricauda hymeniacidonis]
MKTSLVKISVGQAAVIAGIAIVSMTIAAVVATDVSIGKLTISEDPTATFENIKNNQMLFRIGVLSWIVVLVSDIVAAWGLYLFFKPISEGISLVSAWLRIVYTAILGTSILNFSYILELFNTDYQQIIFGEPHLVSQTWIFLTRFDTSWSIGLIIFALHILALGYLCLKSNYVPKLISIFLVIGGMGYFIIHTSRLLVPEYQSAIEILNWIFILPMLSEVALGIWLLVKGKNIQK